tara:strand:+ start:41 stop:1699 length:1659 start_codon:yes stop_codon:yes gene_type:complete
MRPLRASSLIVSLIVVVTTYGCGATKSSSGDADSASAAVDSLSAPSDAMTELDGAISGEDGGSSDVLITIDTLADAGRADDSVGAADIETDTLSIEDSVADDSVAEDAGVDVKTDDVVKPVKPLLVLDEAKPGPTMDRGIGAFDEAIGWATCSNDGGANCPSISWAKVNDPQRGEVLQVTHAAKGKAGLYIASNAGQDLSAFSEGEISFDIKFISGDPQLSIKIDCVWPCSTGDMNLGPKKLGQWQTVKVAVSDLMAQGLKLTSVDTGLVVWATGYKGAVFQLDQVYWKSKKSQQGGNGQPPGKPIDSSKWFAQTQLPDGVSWFNGELQHYTGKLENAFVSDGTLKIVALKKKYTAQGQTKGYTSARLNSKFAFKQGRVEIRAKMQSGGGTWAAIWSLGQNVQEKGGYWQTKGYGTKSWPACGEIDIIEHWGHKQNLIQSAMHTPSSHGATVNLGSQVIPTASTAFHLYELKWSADKMVFSVDGKEHYTYAPSVKNAATWPYDGKQYLLLNIAIESSIDPKFTKCVMEVDYVRVYDIGPSASKKPIWADEFD